VSQVKVGVIGYGYWGPNVVRNLFALEACEVTAIADRNPAALQKARRTYPGLHVTTDANEILTSPDIDAVAIITPVWTHYELARTALENGKHVFVEKPFTSTSGQAEALIELAERRNLRIMVDHTFLFTGAVKKIGELIDAGALGPLLYFDSSRINLGLFQHDVSVIWDLAPHDLAIMDHVIRDTPEAVVATGGTHFGKHADIAFLTIYFPNNVLAHINVNWMSPVKVRTTLIGGREKMLVWNDLEADEKIKVYDKGVTVSSREGVYDLLVSYRSGDVWAPKVAQTEALNAELSYFIECVTNGCTPFNDGAAGLRVVRMLEAADRSLADRGQLVALS
jgi:predicted dehydrogenase